MAGTDNETRILKEFRDAEKKKLNLLNEQRERAIREHTERLAQLDEVREGLKTTIATWSNLLTILEESRAS